MQDIGLTNEEGEGRRDPGKGMQGAAGSARAAQEHRADLQWFVAGLSCPRCGHKAQEGALPCPVLFLECGE